MVDNGQVMKAKQVLQNPGYGNLMEQLGGYLPQGGSSWLTDSDDYTLAHVLTSDAGGWLSAEQEYEFWSLIEETSETDTNSALTDWLENLLNEWGAGGRVAGQDEEETSTLCVTSEQRFVADQITPVAAEYPDWWQGYDYIDGDWKYLKSQDKPVGDSPDWISREEAFALMKETPQPSVALDSSAANALSQLMSAAQQGPLAEFFGIPAEEQSDSEDSSGE
jgi:hypothetical protein